MRVLGWDIGGAHVKAALCAHGRITRVWQRPCPLWRDLKALVDTIAVTAAEAGDVDAHGLTMTGELADVFAQRQDGVRAIIRILQGCLPSAKIWVYAHPPRLWSARRAMTRPLQVASANWSVTAAWLAGRCPDALLVDIGSTTTDIIPIAAGRLAVRGSTDATRLAEEELVYTGVVRTPVMALAERIPFEGSWRAPMAEVFATSADVYRVTRQLPEDADQMPSADGRGKSLQESARRLGRMLGVDVNDVSEMQACAHYLGQAQLWRLHQACARVLSRHALPPAAPVVGAGVGRFLIESLATRLGRPYVDMAGLIPLSRARASMAADLAPAACLALFIHQKCSAD